MGPFEYQVEQMLLERAPTVLMYHGTAEKNVRSILRRGLLPKGVDKAWADDPDTSWVQPSRMSLGGVYLTRNLMTAISSSSRGSNARTGGKRAIIVCQIQPRSLFADEDDFTHIIKSLDTRQRMPTENAVANLYVTQTYHPRSDRKVWEREYDEWRNEWTDLRASRLLLTLRKIHPRLESRVREILYEGFPNVVSRLAAYLPRQTNEWFLGGIQSSREISEPIEFPSIAEGESRFRELARQLTRTLKVFAREDARKSSFNITGRLMKPIDFRGANRIVAIFLFSEDDRKFSIETVYGKIPQETVKAWEQVMGPWRQAA